MAHRRLVVGLLGSPLDFGLSRLGRGPVCLIGCIHDFTLSLRGTNFRVDYTSKSQRVECRKVKEVKIFDFPISIFAF
ncbi:MAG: hypothetical protein DMG21_19050 [Acidobacteria bacterium]|nr:MAG: hypothetical protein DMG21_19050 [Acidobacteriota bacterium]